MSVEAVGRSPSGGVVLDTFGGQTDTGGLPYMMPARCLDFTTPLLSFVRNLALDIRYICVFSSPALCGLPTWEPGLTRSESFLPPPLQFLHDERRLRRSRHARSRAATELPENVWTVGQRIVTPKLFR